MPYRQSNEKSGHVTHPTCWVQERTVGAILAEAILPESARSSRCFRGFAVSKEAVVALEDGIYV